MIARDRGREARRRPERGGVPNTIAPLLCCLFAVHTSREAEGGGGGVGDGGGVGSYFFFIFLQGRRTLTFFFFFFFFLPPPPPLFFFLNDAGRTFGGMKYSCRKSLRLFGRNKLHFPSCGEKKRQFCVGLLLNCLQK